MRKFIRVCLLCALFIAVLNITTIGRFIVQKVIFKNTLVTEKPNEYYKNKNYSLLKETKDLIPNKKEDFKNIVYTILDNGWNSLDFYCDFSYANCTKEFKSFVEDSDMMDIINNYVHPYNSFSNISITTDNFGRVTLKTQKTYAEEEIIKINAIIDDFIKNNISNNMTDKQKIKLFHDFVINNTKYDSSYVLGSRSASTTAYGVLINKSAICSGYSDAMAIFLNKIGVDNYKISSDGHIWNYVYLNGAWYHLDLTWDDPVTSNGKDKLLYDFFLLKTKDLERLQTTQHIYDPSHYPEAKQ